MSPTKKTGGPRKGDSVKLRVNVELLEPERGEVLPQGVAYAFTKGSRLLDSAPLDKRGVATLSFRAAREAQAVRVLVGPAAATDSPRISQIMRRGAVGRTMRIDPDNLRPSIDIAVIPDKWLCWLLSWCSVPGTLMKRVEIDGMPTDLPVCGAEVEVYEVDPLPFIIARLPDLTIRRIRDFIVDGPPWPPTDPFPPEPPVPPDGPQPPPPPIASASGDALERAFASAAGDEFTPVSRPALGTGTGLDVARAFGGAIGDLQVAAISASDLQLRDALVRHPDFTRLVLCRFFPGGLTMDLVGTATTDECGHFRAGFFRGCRNPDTPDLYFKVKQRFGPFTLTIYEKTPVACYTHWNYRCGSEVTLFTTSPFARTCAPCPPIEPPQPGLDWVAVMHIGNTPLSRIRGASVNAGVQASTNAANEGLCFRTVAEANNAAGFDGRPFGATLRPHVEFDNSLRASLGVQYYQVSWRKGTSGTFQPLTGEVHRHYSHEPPGATSPVFEVYSLGPQLVGTTPDLFEIPPGLPPKGQWVVTDLVEDQTSAKFPTGTLAPAAQHGKYQLKIDLYDAAGNLVDIDSLGIVFVVPEQLDLAASAAVTTADAASLGLVVDDDGDGKKSFVMNLHVDNNVCTASIDPALLAAPANSCGVLKYDPAGMGATVTMPYDAVHPNGFATYQFRLKRGVTQLPFTQTGTATPPGSFSQSATVAALTGAYPALGLPACPVAAFSESLHVWALATNGWSRLHAYDDNDHAAFVLAPGGVGA